jgi:hypothetical protein
LLADGIGCRIRMVVRRAAPSSLRMIIRSIAEAARGLGNKCFCSFSLSPLTENALRSLVATVLRSVTRR